MTARDDLFSRPAPSEERLYLLKRQFPECFDKNGAFVPERLAESLRSGGLPVQKEYYSLNWLGKSYAKVLRDAPPETLLAEDAAHNRQPENAASQNLLLKGDNLEILKHLKHAYAGAVKMIYIDPPYNTGSDSFIYPDKFSETREEYARRVGDKDSEGYLKRDGVFQGAWRKNSKDSGHYHSNWLSMMLPRLHLARTLLRDDGVIFISIDDNEQAQLKLLCDEVFGAENFVGQIIWKNATDNNPSNIAVEHEYIFCYCKEKNNLESIWKTSLSETKELLIQLGKDILSHSDNLAEAQSKYTKWFRENKLQLGKLDRYKYIDEKGIYTGSQSVHNPGKEGYRYDVIHPKTKMPCKQPLMGYRFKEETMKHLLSENKVLFGTDHNKIIELKVYVEEFEEKLSSIIELDGRIGAYDLKDIFDKSQIFTNPKPVSLIQNLLPFILHDGDIFLDFFAGSGTTAQAIMQMNTQDEKKRRCICIQLPEELDPNGNKSKAAYDLCQSLGVPPTIAEIAKERIRRAGKQVSDGLKDGQSVDTGFKVFKLSESSFKQWRQPENGAYLEQQLRLAIDSVAEHAAPENMLYELMLRLGCKLTSPVEHKNGVYWVTDEDTGKRIALLLEAANQTLIDEVIAAAPTKVVALDKWFDGNDALKSNTVLQMKDAGIVFECV